MTKRFDPRRYRSPRPHRPLMRALEPVNRLALRHLLRIERIHLPAADLARWRSVVHRGTAAFLGPVHPEFTTDWLLDKELASRLSPWMAHWASYEIVNASPLAQSFWLANRLIANVPGGGGREDSLRCAAEGHGVLLHPEGTATWHAERVAPLLPGIAEMAHAASAAGRPTFIVPVVWRLVFVRDPWPGLAREMEWIERALGLGDGGAFAAPERHARLRGRLLVQRAAALGLPAPPGDPERPGAEYFEMQRRHLAAVRAALEALTGPLDHDLARAQHAARRALRDRAVHDGAGAARGRELLRELQRGVPFSPELHGRPDVTAERVAEDLKRLRAALLHHSLRDQIHNILPVAVAPRTAHLRAPEPIPVTPRDTPDGLLAELHHRLQDGVDRLGAELEPQTSRWRRPNPLACDPGGLQPAPARPTIRA